MDIFQAVVLGIVQGLAEFLPISSSGHLILFPTIFGWEEFTNNLVFDVSLHTGTALAVLIYFWTDWVRITRSFFHNILQPKKIIGDPDSKMFILIFIGTIPAVLIGFLYKDIIVSSLRSPQVVVITLIVFAGILYVADHFGSKKRNMKSLKLSDAVLVGVAQAISLIPGVSRSGVTITFGLFAGLDREASARFSFLLSTPAIIGASVLSFKDAYDLRSFDLSLSVFITGIITSAVVGFLAIKYLLKFIITHNYDVFVWYRIIVGMLGLLFIYNFL